MRDINELIFICCVTTARCGITAQRITDMVSCGRLITKLNK